MTNLMDLENSKKSFQEDFKYENGHYLNKCIVCKSDFVGHKRRVVCKEYEKKRDA